MAKRKKGTLPTFTPVPRLTQRSNGWSDEVQRQFIEALADTGSVRAAAHAVNMTPEGAYALRRHPEAGPFRQAWEAALACGVQRLEDIAMDRATNGVDVPVYSYGKLIGTRTVFNDRLLMFILRNRAPTRFAADGRVTARRSGIGSPHATELSKHKKKWRKEWEAEREAQDARDEDEIMADLNDRFARHHQDWLARMGPRTRTAWLAYKRAEAEETGEEFEEPEWPRLPWLEPEEVGAEDG